MPSGALSEEIDQLFQEVWQTWNLSRASLRCLGTVDLKSDEPGLLEFAGRLRKPLHCWSLAQIGQIEAVPSPSQKVHDKLGVWGVAEPAAMLTAEAEQLLVPKQRGRRCTMAVARRADV